MTRSTDSRRARNSASDRICGRRRESLVSFRRCRLASSRVDPRTPTTSAEDDLGSRTCTTVSSGSSSRTGASGPAPAPRRRRRRLREVVEPPSVESPSASSASAPAASTSVEVEPDAASTPPASPVVVDCCWSSPSACASVPSAPRPRPRRPRRRRRDPAVPPSSVSPSGPTVPSAAPSGPAEPAAAPSDSVASPERSPCSGASWS